MAELALPAINDGKHRVHTLEGMVIQVVGSPWVVAHRAQWGFALPQYSSTGKCVHHDFPIGFLRVCSLSNLEYALLQLQLLSKFDFQILKSKHLNLFRISS